MKSSLNISVCIITYRRPEKLESLLISLKHLEFNKIEEPSWKVIVIDNDEKGSARDVVMKFTKEFGRPITYEIEPQRGISAARNKAVEVAGNVEWIVFIDDDQFALPNWLEELILTQTRYNAKVVAGPVLPEYQESTPAWVKKSGYFLRKRHPTGSVVPYAGTGNLMIDRKIFEKIRFETSLNLVGTADTLFSKRLKEINIDIIWSDEAISYETVPASRANLLYILRREYHKGNAFSLIEMMVRPSLPTVLTRVIKGLGNLMLGAFLFIPLWLIEGRAGLAKALWRGARGLGTLTGTLGVRYHFYRNATTEDGEK